MSETKPMFGTEKLARLKKVLLHNPLESLSTITQANYKYHLSNDVPKVDQYLREHEQYAQLLQAHEVEVLFVRDFVHQTKDLLFGVPKNYDSL